MIATDPAHPTIRRAPVASLDRIVVELPPLPKSLSTNRRLGRSWRSTATDKAQAKRDAFRAFYAAVGPDPPPWKRIGARATVTINDHREELDDDNFYGAIKHSRDEIAQCMGINDKRWKWRGVDFVYDPDAQPGIRLEMWEERPT